MAQTVVLLPGLLCTRRLFASCVAALQRQYNVVIPDLTGHERIDELATDILQHQQLPERFAVAGFSFGGYVALEMARQAPQRIAGLALIASQARPDSDVVRARRQAQIDLVTREGHVNNVLVAQVRALHHESQLPPGYETYLTAPEWRGKPQAEWDAAPELQAFPAFRETVGMARAVGADAFVRQQRTIMSRQDCRHVLTELATTGKTPLAFMHGAEDVIVPKKVPRDLAAAARAALEGTSAHGSAGQDSAGQPSHASRSEPRHQLVQLYEYATTGHMVPLERPDDLQADLQAWMAAVCEYN